MSAHWTKAIGITVLRPEQSQWLMARFQDGWTVGACAQQIAGGNMQFQREGR